VLICHGVFTKGKVKVQLAVKTATKTTESVAVFVKVGAYKKNFSLNSVKMTTILTQGAAFSCEKNYTAYNLSNCDAKRQCFLETPCDRLQVLWLTVTTLNRETTQHQVDG
jgi:hypothetical protein